jgi:hypothetical protein
LTRLAALQRQKVNAQKLASQVGRTLQRLKAHKYFTCEVDAQGRLKWARKGGLIEQERQIDGWFLLHTNQSVEQCDGPKTLAHYKNLLQAEEAFCQLKSYLEVRPVFHWRPDRVINHVRLCFLAYWLSARLGKEWRDKGEREEPPRLLRKLQTIRAGSLRLGISRRTRFGWSRSWIFYAVAGEETKASLPARGVVAENIAVTGIPIAPKFALPVDKTAVRRRYGLRDDMPTLRVLGGGFGMGPVVGILGQLDKWEREFQTLVVAGRNDTPISGATITIGNCSALTRGDGKFSVPGCSPEIQEVTAQAPGYLSWTMQVNIAENAELLSRVRLRHGKPLRLRIVDEEGNPIPNVFVIPIKPKAVNDMPVTWLNENNDSVKWTDEEGRATWTNAPDTDINLEISAVTFGKTRSTIHPDGQEHTIKLTGPRR